MAKKELTHKEEMEKIEIQMFLNTFSLETLRRIPSLLKKDFDERCREQLKMATN